MVRLLRLLAAVAVSCSTVLAAGTSGSARAANCLPPPQILFGEVARVAGTGSTVWADLQALQATDAARGTSGPGQVVIDLLGAAARDGYQWDCGRMQMVAPANAPPRNDQLPGAPAAQPAATVAGTAGGGTGAGGTGAGNADPQRATATTGPAGTTVPGTDTPAASILAGPVASTSGGGIPVVLLIVLALVTGLVIVWVVRRQMTHH